MLNSMKAVYPKDMHAAVEPAAKEWLAQRSPFTSEYAARVAPPLEARLGMQALICCHEVIGVVDPDQKAAQDATADAARQAAQSDPNLRQCPHCPAYSTSNLDMARHFWH